MRPSDALTLGRYGARRHFFRRATVPHLLGPSALRNVATQQVSDQDYKAPRATFGEFDMVNLFLAIGAINT